MTDVPALLSCEQCKKRKTKCDKTFPRCSACKVAGIDCHPVQRARLPRGRTGKFKHKSNALADKVARLESLVGRLEAQIHDSENDTASSLSGEPVSGSSTLHSSNRVENMIARDFWTALSNEVIGLRETLESNTDEHNHPDVVQRIQDQPTQQTSNTLLFNEDATFTTNEPSHVNQSMRASLVQVYYDRVDILCKITHWPTILNTIHCNGSNPTDVGPSSVPTLEWCICFMAACALSDQDCAQMELGSRNILVGTCRVAAERSLSQARFLTEPSFSILQAFTIYLMGLRACGDGAMVWSLLALAVRLANALNLGSENDNTLSAIDLEQRRRLWFGIGLLDSQAAFGRGSTPLLSYKELRHPPLNINDSEVGVQTVSNHPITEMSVSHLTHQAMLCQRKLCDPSHGATWQSQLEVIGDFESLITRTYANLEFSTVPLERYTAIAAKDMLTNMQLILRRPLYKTTDANPQNAAPKSDTFDILSAATSILERGLTKQHSAEFVKWSWFSWPRWYALAIVLVELCTSTSTSTSSGTPPSSTDKNTAYAVAKDSFASYAQSAADVSSGMLWHPITKLMKRVRQLHNDADLTPQFDLTSTSDHKAPSAQVPQLGEATINSRFHPDLRMSLTEPDAAFGPNADMDMEFDWDSFLEDMNRSSDSSATAGSGSSWSLMPYLPVFPHRVVRDGGSETRGGRSTSFDLSGVWA